MVVSESILVRRPCDDAFDKIMCFVVACVCWYRSLVSVVLDASGHDGKADTFLASPAKPRDLKQYGFVQSCSSLRHAWCRQGLCAVVHFQSQKLVVGAEIFGRYHLPAQIPGPRPPRLPSLTGLLATFPWALTPSTTLHNVGKAVATKAAR